MKHTRDLSTFERLQGNPGNKGECVDTVGAVLTGGWWPFQGSVCEAQHTMTDVSFEISMTRRSHQLIQQMSLTAARNGKLCASQRPFLGPRHVSSARRWPRADRSPVPSVHVIPHSVS